MLLIGDNMTNINKIQRSLRNEFEMKDLSNAKRILGMDIVINRPKNILILKQSS